MCLIELIEANTASWQLSSNHALVLPDLKKYLEKKDEEKNMQSYTQKS